MLHKSLLKCISNTGAETSFTDSTFDVMNITYKLSKKSSSATLSLSKLKKKFNSSNEKLSLHLKSKLKSKMPRGQSRKHKTKKSVSNLSNSSILTFNSSNIMSSTAINTTTRTNLDSLYSISISEFYSENSDESDDDYDSDMSFEDTYLEQTLRYINNDSFQDASLDSMDSQEETTIAEFNPTISSSRYETSVCSRCVKRRSLGTFLPEQTSSRIVLVTSDVMEVTDPNLSKIYVKNGYDFDDSNYFSFEKNMNKTVFSSTMITSL